jgi:M penetrans paralogue family 26
MTENPNTYQPNSPLGSQQIALPNATTSLVLGIISIATCWLYGIPRLICGIIGLILSNKDRALYRSNPHAYTPGSFSNSNAGRICAIIGLIIFLFVIIMFAVFGAIITDFKNIDNFNY